MKHTSGDLGIFWPSMLGQAIVKDPRFNSGFNQQVIADLYQRYQAGEFKSTPPFICAFEKFLPADFYIRFGDSPNESDLTKCKNHPRPVLILSPTVYSGRTKQKLQSLVHTVGPEYYSAYYEHYNIEFDQVIPDKDFTCLISRMDPIRQSWLYLLVRRQLFDKGYVSFNMDTSRLNEFADLDPMQVFEEQYKKYLLEFTPEHNYVRDLVPYKNFPADIDLDQLLMQSRFNIVLETYFVDNEELTFTEKTIRSLRLPRPWILFSSKHAVKQLRAWGFDTLDDLVDHSYDNIDNNIVRQSAVLDAAEKLCNFDVVQHWTRLQQASAHNLQLLQSWKNNVGAAGLRDCAAALDKIHALYGSK